MDQPPAETLDRLARDLADVDVALARLDDGTYGTCETCGARLDGDVLADRPTLRTCPEHTAPEPVSLPAAPAPVATAAPTSALAGSVGVAEAQPLWPAPGD